MAAVKKSSASVGEIVKHMRSLINPENRAGMARFGINADKAFGISMVEIRKMAKETGKDHELAQGLWDTGIHEALILACLVDDHKQVTEAQMDSWVAGFDSWDVCDQCCMNLFDRTPYANKKCFEWANDEREFVKRAGYVVMASLAVHDKKAPDEAFERFFPALMAGAVDKRNFVKKAVNWALRQIGKRNMALNKKALGLAREMQKLDSKSARWIAADAIRELESQAVQERLLKKQH